MYIKSGQTPTGQEYVSFKTQYNEKCTLVASEKFLRCALRRQDDVSMEAPFTHFTREQVKELLPYLQAFVEDGTLGLKG